jgi:hypothetical protein
MSIQVEGTTYSNPLREFTSSFGFIVYFLVSTLIFNMVFGDDVTTAYLWLILLGMLVLNADKTVALLNKYSHT